MYEVGGESLVSFSLSFPLYLALRAAPAAQRAQQIKRIANSRGTPLSSQQNWIKDVLSARDYERDAPKESGGEGNP